MGPTRGLFQLTTGGTWYVKRAVPADVRDRLTSKAKGRRWFQSTTGTRDLAAAKLRAAELWAGWSAEIAAARALGKGPVATAAEALAVIDRWRARECGRAADLEAIQTHVEIMGAAKAAVAAYMVQPGAEPRPWATSPEPYLPVTRRALALADAYFVENPQASRSPDLPYAVGMLLGRLQASTENAEGWAAVEGFDRALDAALWPPGGAGGLVGTLQPHVRAEVRQRFAVAWLEVERHREAERRRHVTILAALEAAQARPDNIAPAPAAGAYQVRADDFTVGEIIDRYRAARIAKHGAESTDRKYAHLFRAMREALGETTPIRAVRGGDIERVKELLESVPANAGKHYPKKTLKEAVELAKVDREKGLKRPGMARNTIRSYLSNASAVFNYAVRNEWADKNPVEGRVGGKENSVKRRGFKREELEALFASLEEERKAKSARYWVPAILFFSGARANEVCQLHTDDVKEHDGVHYLDFTLFSDDGRRIENRRLKTAGAARAIPIHPELISAGFLAFVARRREAGGGQLFPELKPRGLADYSHGLSKWFGLHMDGIGLTAPGLVLHSARHGFRDSCVEAGLPRDVTDRLGGWTTPGVGAGYGDATGVGMLAENLRHLERVKIAGGFTLPR